MQPADVHHSIPLDSDDIGRMHAIDDAATFEAGEHDMQKHAVGEAPDTREHFTSARAEAPRAHRARLHAARVQDAGEQDAGECDAAAAADMRRVTRARTRAVEPGPLTDSGEQAQVQKKNL